jgi:hypothetical protein
MSVAVACPLSAVAAVGASATGELPALTGITAGPARASNVAALYNWSGYTASGSSAFNEVKATYVQPAVTCTVANAWALFWVGFDGFDNNTVEQAGTAAECGGTEGTTPVYFAWWEMYPTNYLQFMPLNVDPGDTIVASVTYNPLNKNYAMKVADQTLKKNYTAKSPCDSGLTCARDSADWIMERPKQGSGYTALADWNNITMSYAKASNTYSLGNPVLKPISSFTNTAISMVNGTGGTLASAAPLNTAGGKFQDTWSASE